MLKGHPDLYPSCVTFIRVYVGKQRLNIKPLHTGLPCGLGYFRFGYGVFLRQKIRIHLVVLFAVVESVL